MNCSEGKGVVEWIPGFDHAGLATQICVDNEMKKSGVCDFAYYYDPCTC
jgi:valyl-tRNA synthetase